MQSARSNGGDFFYRQELSTEAFLSAEIFFIDRSSLYCITGCVSRRVEGKNWRNLLHFARTFVGGVVLFVVTSVSSLTSQKESGMSRFNLHTTGCNNCRGKRNEDNNDSRAKRSCPFCSCIEVTIRIRRSDSNSFNRVFKYVVTHVFFLCFFFNAFEVAEMIYIYIVLGVVPKSGDVVSYDKVYLA